jgi:hypothetical protein
MSFRHIEVVRLDRDRREDVVDVALPGTPPAPVGQRDSQEQLGSRYRCDRCIVIVRDQLVERLGAALRVDEYGRVEDQSRQRRSSGASIARARRTLSTQSASRGTLRSSAFTSRP